MTIINPNSISGISSITALNSTAAINLFKADGTAANIIAGVVTATKFVGELSVGSSITFEDNEKAYFGNDGDMQLYHDGSKSVIANKTGYLQINATATEPGIYVNPNAAVKLLYNGDQKFETTDTGVKVFNGSSGTGVLEVYSPDTSSSAGPELKLYRNSASPADADYLGQIKFAGESDTSVERNYAKITGKILDASNGTEDGILEFAHIKAGSQTITGRWRSDSLQLLNSTNFSVAGTSTFVGTATGTIFKVPDATNTAGATNHMAVGDNSDLKLYHDNNGDAYITNDTGHLTIRNDTSGKVINLQPKSGANGIIARYEGAAELYHNNVKKFETQSTGNMLSGAQQNLHGDVKFDNQTNLGMDLRWDESLNRLHFEQDNIKAVFGGSSDLEIYHDGSTNIINGLYHPIELRHQSEVHIKCVDDGAVELYNNNSRKLRTYSDGVKIASDANTGRLVLEDTSGNYCYQLTGYNVTSAGAGGRATFQDSTGAVVLDMRASGGNIFSYNTIKLNAGNTVDNLKVTFGTNDDFQIYHDPNYNILKGINAQATQFWTNNSPRWRIQAGGHIMPEANNTYDIGTSSYKIKDIYANGNLNINGNIVMASAASGRGIDFSASANASNASASMSSELFDDYEEGTFTPTDVSGQGITITNNNPAHYTKIGRFVHVTFDCTWAGGHTGGGNAAISLPFLMGEEYGSGSVGWNQVNKPLQVHVNSAGAQIMENYSNGSGARHLSNNSASGNRIIGDCSYFTGT